MVRGVVRVLLGARGRRWPWRPSAGQGELAFTVAFPFTVRLGVHAIASVGAASCVWAPHMVVLRSQRQPAPVVVRGFLAEDDINEIFQKLGEVNVPIYKLKAF